MGRAGRRALLVGCWVAALGLLVPVAWPVLVPPETGAETPEAAVAQLLQGVADLDPVAVARMLDPDEVADPGRAADAYDALGAGLRRVGDVPPTNVTRVLAAAEGQAGSASLDRDVLTTLAAVDMDLVDLELDVEDRGDAEAWVYLVDGALDVTVDPGNLPDGMSDEVRELDRASYTMPVAEGWRRDSRPIRAFLVAVETDGRWHVSLRRTAEAVLDGASLP